MPFNYQQGPWIRSVAAADVTVSFVVQIGLDQVKITVFSHATLKMKFNFEDRSNYSNDEHLASGVHTQRVWSYRTVGRKHLCRRWWRNIFLTLIVFRLSKGELSIIKLRRGLILNFQAHLLYPGLRLPDHWVKLRFRPSNNIHRTLFLIQAIIHVRSKMGIWLTVYKEKLEDSARSLP